MSTMVFFIVVATLATVGILMAGGLSMVRGGDYDRTHAFPLMEARVIAQTLAIGLMFIAILFWT